MKTSSCTVLILTSFVFAIVGCDRIAFISDTKQSAENTMTVTPVDDPQLAKLILKPNIKSIEIPRDPFKPIYTTSPHRVDTKKIEPIRTTFSDVYFIGMVRMDNQAIALVKVNEKKVMLKLNEQYRGFIVKDINNANIVFSNGENQITLKRGAKK